MLGMGEGREEVVAVMHDLRVAGCDLFTLGQYLPPSRQHYSVRSFPAPEEFAAYIPIGLEMGFKAIAAAPLWRSSYKADELYRQAVAGR
jgi:lipoic acid synthetase